MILVAVIVDIRHGDNISHTFRDIVKNVTQSWTLGIGFVIE